MQILVADDDPVYQRVLTGLVRRMGHDVSLATDGEAAWELYREMHPRLVLADWVMPRLSGVELCRRVRREGESLRPHIVLITTLSDDERILEGFAAGADDYVAKPFHHRVLESRISASVEAIHGALLTEEKLHREVVSRRQEELGAEHPSLAGDLEALARNYLERGVFGKARAFLRRQIDIAGREGDERTMDRLRVAIAQVALQEEAATARSAAWTYGAPTGDSCDRPRSRA